MRTQPERFCGTVQELCPVEIDSLRDWILSIPLTEWHQQEKMRLKPAMMTDHAWQGFGKECKPVVDKIMEYFPGCVPYQEMLSVVMPGDTIPKHKDKQAEYWLCRVHVPLKTNPRSEFFSEGVSHLMRVGKAYKVNTLAEHAVINWGLSPRIHFMVDIGRR